MPAIHSRRAVAGLMLGSAALLAGCAPGPAVAQRAGFPDFADLAERVLPAVVNIAVVSRETQPPPEIRGSPLERYFRDRQRNQPIAGAGSGFIIDPSGLIVTNNHVVGNATSVRVSLQDGTDYQARVVGSDELTDLALIRIQPTRSLPSVPFGNSSAVRIGQWVLAAGNPFGLGGSVTSGIVSARGRDIGTGPFDDFIQTDAPINPGNSGGPLFNMAGEVIGITTAIYSPSGASAGIGFAVPSDLARRIVEQLRAGGRVERGWLGVSVRDANQEETRRSGRGAVVEGVERNSPAARAGIRAGDVVVAINGERLEGSRSLVRTVAAMPPGQTVRLQLLREGRQTDIAVQIGRRPQGQG